MTRESGKVVIRPEVPRVAGGMTVYGLWASTGLRSGKLVSRFSPEGMAWGVGLSPGRYTARTISADSDFPATASEEPLAPSDGKGPPRKDTWAWHPKLTRHNPHAAQSHASSFLRPRSAICRLLQTDLLGDMENGSRLPATALTEPSQQISAGSRG